MYRSREDVREILLREELAIVPEARSRTVVPRRETTPNPVTRVPGSTPSTTVALRVVRPGSVAERCKFLVFDVEVGVDVLHVVMLFERIHKLHHVFRIPTRDLDGVLRNHL